MGKPTISCPYCSSYQVVRNGHPHSKKLEFFCKSCHKYSYEDTAKGYPPTNVPFPVIAYLLYFRKKIPAFSNMREYRNFVNQWLRCLGIKKGEISRQIIHHWIKNYEPLLDEVINFEETRDYCHRILQEKLKKVSKEFVKEKTHPYKETLFFLEQYFGSNFLTKLARSDPIFFRELTSIASKYPIYCRESIESKQELRHRLFFKGVVQ